MSEIRLVSLRNTRYMYKCLIWNVFRNRSILIFSSTINSHLRDWSDGAAHEETKNELKLNRLPCKTEGQNACDGVFNFRMVFVFETRTIYVGNYSSIFKWVSWSSQLALTHLARTEFSDETSPFLLNRSIQWTKSNNVWLSNSYLSL